MTRTDYAAIAPMLIVMLSGCAVLVFEAFRRKDEQWPFGGLAIIGLVGAMVASLWSARDFVGFGVIVVDNFTIFFNVTLCAIGILTILMSSGTADRDRL